MLAPYIYDTNSVQERLLCRAEATNNAPESAKNVSEIAGQENYGGLEVQDLDSVLREPSSLKSRL